MPTYNAVERKLTSAIADLQTEVEHRFASEILEFTSITRNSSAQGRAEAREFIVGVLLALETLPAASRQKIRKRVSDIEALSSQLSAME